MNQSVDAACSAALEAFDRVPLAGPSWSADLLDRIAVELESDRERIVATAEDESHLGTARLNGELSRTTGQLQAFAAWASSARASVEVHDEADPDAVPAPSPDLQRVDIPLGPIAVFAASNFPLAFGVVGGDTAAALAAGNPVVARAHPLQIATARAVSDAVDRALGAIGAPAAWFQLIDDPDQAVGADLVRHDAIRAVGFTGSQGGGMALAAIAAQRPVPIPVYAEMGSVNPLFVTAGAIESDGDGIAAGLAGSITLGVGQFCTKPGLVVVGNDAGADAFVDRLVEALGDVAPQPMLSPGMATAFRSGFDERAAADGVTTRLAPAVDDDGRMGPGLVEIGIDDLGPGHVCLEEMFGPGAVVVRTDRLERIADLLPGSLTVTIHSVADDDAERAELLRRVGRRAGRIVHNGFPTGVAVKPAMQHGGPFPASNHERTTSVGLAAADRFRRPVTLQSWPVPIVDDLTAEPADR